MHNVSVNLHALHHNAITNIDLLPGARVIKNKPVRVQRRYPLVILVSAIGPLNQHKLLVIGIDEVHLLMDTCEDVVELVQTILELDHCSECGARGSKGSVIVPK
jgi:uncharacterized membrane protein